MANLFRLYFGDASLLRQPFARSPQSAAKLVLLIGLFAIIVAPLIGCGPAETVETEEKPRELRSVDLLIIDDPPLAAAINEQWSAKGDSELNVTEMTSAELLLLEKRPDADAVIYPTGLLGELAQRKWLDPMPTSALETNAYSANDVLLLPREFESRWGEEEIAIPFSSPQMMVAVRQDLLDQFDAEPPKTWVEYHKLARLLADAAGDDAKAWSPAVEPLGDGWGGEVLLARTAPYIRDSSRRSALFDLQSMEPQIEAEPFVRALTRMADIASMNSDETLARATPAEALNAIYTGRCGMALTWPMNADIEAAADIQVTYHQLPGAREVWRFSGERWDQRPGDDPTRAALLASSGMLASLIRDTDRSRSAGAVLAILSGVEWSPLICAKSAAAGVFRGSHLQNIDPWISPAIGSEGIRSFEEAVIDMQTSEFHLFSPRIPGRARYIKALDDAVSRAILEKQDPQAALAEAAEEWREITKSIGLESQKKAYRLSLGIR